MPTYVIFDRETGRIVQTHTQPGELALTREELREEMSALVGTEYDSSNLDFKLVEDAAIDAERALQIDVETGTLQPADENEATGFGVSAVASSEVTGMRRRLKKEYQRGRDYGRGGKDHHAN